MSEFNSISSEKLKNLYNTAVAKRETDTSKYFDLEFPEELDYLADDEKLEHKLCRQIDEGLVSLDSLPLTSYAKDRFANVLVKLRNMLDSNNELTGVQNKIVIAQTCRDKMLEWYNQFDDEIDKDVRNELLILGTLFNKIVKYLSEYLPND